MIISYKKCSLRITPRRFLVRWIGRHFEWVKAAGGVVEDEAERRLLIERDGQWDLPKGMVEKGETLRQAAKREVQEETGLEHIDVGPLIIKTYHIYNKYGGWHIKQTSWYKMRSSATSPTLPQTEEGISKVEWVERKEWSRRMENSYATLKLLAKI